MVEDHRSKPTAAPPPAPSHHQAKKEVKKEHVGARTVELNGLVGLNSLPHQLVNKTVETGFRFNLMCVGETGTGKTTLIESLFNMKIDFEPCTHELKTVKLLEKPYDMTEGGTRVKLRLVETAGFGDQLDKDNSAKVIADYLDAQFERYLQEELKIRRMLKYFEDSRIHACLYFISPTGHGLKALDLVTLRELSKRVNVIPVIAKADTTSRDELTRIKQKVMNDLRSQKIEIYQFPTDDETLALTNAEMNATVPFAVCGSNEFLTKENGVRIRARKYAWGIVEVENEAHCDFVKLREALLRTNVDAMRERTHNELYENYRRERLRAMRMGGEGDSGLKMIEAFGKRQKEYQEDIVNRELQLRKEFEVKLNKKEAEMREREEALTARARKMEDEAQAELDQLQAEIHCLSEEKSRLALKISKKFGRK